MTAGSFRIRDLLWIIAGGPACWPLALQILRPAACEINLTTLPGCGCGCGAVRGHNFPLAYLVRLRQARLAAGLTRAQLARRADVTLYTVTKLEDGPAEPGVRVAGGVITALSRVLGVEPLWLTCQEPEDWAGFPARVPPRRRRNRALLPALAAVNFLAALAVTGVIVLPAAVYAVLMVASAACTVKILFKLIRDVP